MTEKVNATALEPILSETDPQGKHSFFLSGGLGGPCPYIFSRSIAFIRNGGRKTDRGRETTNPAPQPASHADRKIPPKPTLMAVIAKAIHMDMITDITIPKNSICLMLIKDAS
jgi:hypothetical protein